MVARLIIGIQRRWERKTQKQISSRCAVNATTASPTRCVVSGIGWTLKNKSPSPTLSLMATIKLKLSGPSLIQHNGQTADPRNRYSKALREISSKRKKTDADLDELARIEFLAGLYLAEGSITLPDHVVEAALVGGAKKSKNGPTCKMAVFVDGPAVLDFAGNPGVINDETLQQMWEGGEHHLTAGVRVGQAKVMRTRPHLRDWSAVVTVSYEEDLVNRQSVIEFAQDAGRQVGLCDWRPKHGRFQVEVVEG